MTLAEKLHAIQRLARKVPKNGYNEREDFYYTRIEDVVTVGANYLRKYKLFLTPNLATAQRAPNERGGGSIVDLIMEWTLVDLESLETRTFRIPGSGWDYNSKSTAKALTDSRKSAFVLIFNLKGGDDPEERGPIARDAAKDRQQEVADKKLANAEAGKGIDADVPALQYTWSDETQTGVVTGDKELLKSTALLFKEYKFPKSATQWYVNAAQLERIQLVTEERGIPLKKLLGAS